MSNDTAAVRGNRIRMTEKQWLILQYGLLMSQKFPPAWGDQTPTDQEVDDLVQWLSDNAAPFHDPVAVVRFVNGSTIEGEAPAPADRVRSASQQEAMPGELVDRPAKWFWVSWWSKEEDYRPLSSPPSPVVLGWWVSGQRGPGDRSICAAVAATTAEAAKMALIVDWPELAAEDVEWRFLTPKSDLPKFKDRFPLDDWMKPRFAAIT